jgi:hypothetical protein
MAPKPFQKARVEFPKTQIALKPGVRGGRLARRRGCHARGVERVGQKKEIPYFVAVARYPDPPAISTGRPVTSPDQKPQPSGAMMTKRNPRTAPNTTPLHSTPRQGC